MDLLTKQDLVDNICSAWKQQYYFAGKWNHGYNKEMIYNDLVKLVIIKQPKILLK